MDPRHIPPSRRIINDYEVLAKAVESYRLMGWEIVVTIGTFDMIHIGHSRYLEAAKQRGHVLIVGVDSDAAVKRYKGPGRPAVPEGERLEMLLHLSYVDLVTLVDDVDSNGVWAFGLLDALHPDVYVATEDSYDEEQLVEIRKRCKELVVLPRQAPTSTSEKLRAVALASNKSAAAQLHAIADKLERGEFDA